MRPVEQELDLRRLILLYGVPNDEQLENLKSRRKIFIFNDFLELLRGILAYFIKSKSAVSVESKIRDILSEVS